MAESWETINSQWEAWFGRQQTISGKLAEDQVVSKLSQSLEKLKRLRGIDDYPQVLLDIWEEKFRRWLAEAVDLTNEV